MSVRFRQLSQQNEVTSPTSWSFRRMSTTSVRWAAIVPSCPNERHSLEFAYDYSVFNDDLEVRDSPDPTVNGDYEIESQLISVSYGIRL